MIRGYLDKLGDDIPKKDVDGDIYCKGYLLLCLGDVEKGEEYLKMLFEKDPKNLKVINKLLNVYILQKDFEKCTLLLNRVFKEYIKHDIPPFLFAKYLRILILHNKISEAIAFKKQLQEVFQSSMYLAKYKDSVWKLYFELGNLESYIGQYEKAIASYLKALSSLPPTSDFIRAKLLYLIALSYYSLEDYNSAITYLKKSIALSPNYSKSYVLLGIIYLKNNKLDTAQKYLHYALKLNPADKQALKYLNFLKNNKQEV
ncbi:tetratricopeptide repeat protein [Thermococcus sp.]